TIARVGGIAVAVLALTQSMRADWVEKDWTAVEKANVKVVTEVFHAWEKKDGAAVERLFAPDAVVRFTRIGVTTEPWTGVKAIRAAFERQSKATTTFQMPHAVAEGPIVVIRRIDRWTDSSGQHCEHHGLKNMAVCDDQFIAVFTLEDGKI